MFALEFSFDRTRDSHLRQSETGSAQAPEAVNVRPGPDLNSQDPSTIANERLRKAIERNRAKQAARTASAPEAVQAAPTAAPVTPAPAPEAHEQASFFSQPAAQPIVEPAPEVRSYVRPMPEARPVEPEPMSQASQDMPRRPRVRVRENVSSAASYESEAASTATSTGMVSRRSVAKPEDTEFVPTKRGTRKVASHISYTTSGTSRKKQKSLDPKYVTWLVKGSWIFCGIMVLRLIFASGGITDFYSQKSVVSEKLAELSNIKKENMQLVREIERMRSDSGFQKRLVRDNLGFIANDEFLVLFPKER